MGGSGGEIRTAHSRNAPHPSRLRRATFPGGEGFWGRFRFQIFHILFFLAFDFSSKISIDYWGALDKSARADSERFCFQARD